MERNKEDKDNNKSGLLLSLETANIQILALTHFLIATPEIQGLSELAGDSNKPGWGLQLEHRRVEVRELFSAKENDEQALITFLPAAFYILNDAIKNRIRRESHSPGYINKCLANLRELFIKIVVEIQRSEDQLKLDEISMENCPFEKEV